MRNDIVRRALRDHVSRDDIDDAIAEVGCQPVNIIPQTDSHPEQWIYASSDRSGFLYLVQDGRLGVAYFSAQGATMVRQVEALGQHLDFISSEEIEAMASNSSDPSTFARALALTALTTVGDPPARAVEILREGLDHPNAEVRNVALLAVTYAPWPPLRDAIEQRAARDEEPLARQMAQQILATFFQ